MSSSNVFTAISDYELANLMSEKKIDFDWCLMLKNNWFLKNDKKRVLLIEIDEAKKELGKFSRFSTYEALVVTMLGDEITLNIIKERLVKLLELPEKDIEELIVKFLSLNPDAFTLRKENASDIVYDPKDFIIPLKETDTKSYRCHYPLSITLHLSDACLRKCIYCNVIQRVLPESERLTTEQVFNIIDQAAELGVVTVDLAGGEPLIRKDIVQIVERIIQRKMLTFLSTKAYVSEELARQLKEIGLHSIQISFDSSEESVADLLVGSVGFYKEAIKSLENCKKAGLPVRINSMVTPYNIKAIPQLVKLLSNYPIEYITFTTPSRSLYNGQVSDSLFINQQDGKWLEELIPKLQDEYPEIKFKPFEFSIDYSLVSRSEKAKEYPERAFCSAGRYAFIVYESGDVILCEETPLNEETIMGNVKSESLIDIWQSDKINNFLLPDREKFKGTACYDCPDESYYACHTEQGRCWREALKAFDLLYSPSPNCPRAPVGKRVM